MSTVTRNAKKLLLSEEFLESFSSIPDKRTGPHKLHSLQNILIIAVCAILCGADSWLAVEQIGKCKLKWFRKFLQIPDGIPSHDTFARVFAVLTPGAIQQFLVKWGAEFQGLIAGNTVAIDGKTQRRSFRSSSMDSPIHMVSAFACESGITLGVKKTNTKSNEIKAIPKVLDMVNIKDATVTIDAMGCHKNIANKICEKGADYVLAVKKNQLGLYLQAQSLLKKTKRAKQSTKVLNFLRTEENAHGRKEIRKYWITDRIEYLRGKELWKNLTSIGCVESTRKVDGKTSVETRYFITSLGPDVNLFAKHVRNHWKIENACHWMLDVIFRADDNRMRIGYSAENFSALQYFALNLLKIETSAKTSVRIKRHMCANDESYLQKVLVLAAKSPNA